MLTIETLVVVVMLNQDVSLVQHAEASVQTAKEVGFCFRNDRAMTSENLTYIADYLAFLTGISTSVLSYLLARYEDYAIVQA